MATAQNLYDPITIPPGGLLASAVGTVQAPLPPINPDSATSIMPTVAKTQVEPQRPQDMIAPPPGTTTTTSLATNIAPVTTPTAPQVNTSGGNYTLEGQTAAGNLTSLLGSDSTYIRQAEAAGQRTAQRRGLLNSSIAAGASRGAAIDKAAPIALADAAASNQRDLTRLDAGFQGERLNTSLTQQQQLQTQSLQAESERLGRQLTVQEQQAVLDRVNQQYLQTQELNSRQALQDQSIAAESERLGRQLTAQEVAQQRDIADRQYQQQQDIASRSALQTQSLDQQATLAREDMAAQLERLGLTEAAANLRANLSAATQVQMQTLQNLNQQQQSSLQYYSQMQQSYMSAIQSVWNNENIPAPARQDAINMFASVLNSGVNLPAAVYGVNMTWPGSGSTGATPAPAPAPVGTTATPVPTSGSNVISPAVYTPTPGVSGLGLIGDALYQSRMNKSLVL